MTYWLDLFTPNTWQNFRSNGANVTGFREAQRRSGARVAEGDVFLCYLVGLSRWCGVLTATSKMFEDDTPYFDDPDPFTIRFDVRPDVVLDFDRSVPIFEPELWNHLSGTKEIDGRVPGWAQTANLRASLRELSEQDGELIVRRLTRQSHEQEVFDLNARDHRRIKGKKRVRAQDRDVLVDVPDEDDAAEDAETNTPQDPRQSHQIQAALCEIGMQMGFRIWLPKADRQSVLSLCSDRVKEHCLDLLPLNYDDATLKTVEQIDVIWLKNRSMARAFEVEHTTAVYSGLLRMADLLALQPNMSIKLHIVAPEERRDKVLREVSRPVFSLLDSGPLYESCTYLSYDSIEAIAALDHLEFMKDAIIEQYQESADED